MGASLSKILRKTEILFAAWRRVRASGVQSPSQETRDAVRVFDSDAPRALRRIGDQLRQSRFVFAPQRGVTVKRPGKKSRPLVIGSLENRIVQRAILDVLQAQTFVQSILATPTSIGGIPRRDRQRAVALVLQAIRNGAQFFVRSDIRDFFTAIPRDRILRWIGVHVDDYEFMDLVRRATETNLSNLDQLADDALLFPLRETGVAQGNPLSPLMGNILLKEFDDEMNGRGIVCIRYIDDFILLGPRASAVQAAFTNAQRILRQLGLRAYDPFLGDAKAETGSTKDSFEFLGCQLSSGLVQPTRAATDRLLLQVDEILADGRHQLRSAACAEHGRVPRQRFVQTANLIDRTIQGWGQAYSFCDGRNRFEQIDREVDRKLKKFRKFAYVQMANATPRIRRRILGVHVLADTPIERLPTMQP